MNLKSKRSKRIWLILTILCTVGIAFSSSIEGDVSGEASRDIAAWLKGIFPFLYGLDLGFTNFLVRKAAHFFVFMVLAVCLTNLLKFYIKGKIRLFFAAWLAASVYGIIDEIHQYFVPGRVCAIQDMLINSAGALVGVILVMFISKRRKKHEI